MRKRPRSDEKGSSGSGSGSAAGAGAGGVTQMEKDDDDDDTESKRRSDAMNAIIRDREQKAIQKAAEDKEMEDEALRIEQKQKREAEALVKQSEELQNQNKKEDEDFMTRLGLSSYKKSAVGERLPGIYTNDEKQAIMFLEELGLQRDMGKVILSYFPQLYTWEPVTELRPIHYPNLPWHDGSETLQMKAPWTHYLTFGIDRTDEVLFHVGKVTELFDKTGPLHFGKVIFPQAKRFSTFYTNADGSALMWLHLVNQRQIGLYSISTDSKNNVPTLIHVLNEHQFNIDLALMHSCAYAVSPSGNAYMVCDADDNKVVIAYRDNNHTDDKWNVTITKLSNPEYTPRAFFLDQSDDLLFLVEDNQQNHCEIFRRQSGYTTQYQINTNGDTDHVLLMRPIAERNGFLFADAIKKSERLESPHFIAAMDIKAQVVHVVSDVPARYHVEHILPQDSQTLIVIFGRSYRAEKIYQIYKPSKRYTGQKKIKQSGSRLIPLAHTALQTKSKEFYALITTAHHPSDPWPKMDINDSETVYFIEGLTRILARFVVTRQSHTIIINEIRMDPVLASSMTAVGRMINQLLLGTVLGHEIQLTMVEKVMLHIDSRSTLPWKEYGFVVDGNMAVREYISPSELKSAQPLSHNHRRPQYEITEVNPSEIRVKIITYHPISLHQWLPYIDWDGKYLESSPMQTYFTAPMTKQTDVITTLESKGFVKINHHSKSQDTALIWKKMHDLANGFVWSTKAAEDIKHTFSQIRKLLECRECRLHYSTFWSEHPIDLYLTEDENVNDGDFSIKMWVNNCHNEVNVRRNQPVWYL